MNPRVFLALASRSALRRDPLLALGLVLGSLEALRNLRALYVLLMAFALSGLLMATAQSALGAGAEQLAALEVGAAFFVAFYGGNAAGLLLMDDALGIEGRTVGDAVAASLRTAHRVLFVVAGVALVVAGLGATLAGLLWLSRASVAGAAGPALFGLVMPFGVLAVGLVALALLAVVVPLSAPGVWAGDGVRTLWRRQWHWVRHRLLTAALLTAAVGALTAGVGAVTSFVVLTGGRIVSSAAVVLAGVDLPPEQLMAGLFGQGLRGGGAAGVPAGSAAYAATGLVGGGLVFALALVVPGLVYLRGTCAVYVALSERLPGPAGAVG